MSPSKELAAKILKARQEQDLSVRAVAKATGLSPATISRAERGVGELGYGSGKRLEEWLSEGERARKIRARERALAISPAEVLDPSAIKELP